MGVAILEMGIKIRKVTIFIIRTCYRSVHSHPFLVVMFCLLVLLYRSSPFVFSLLVSASPVLVCTAVLLGTLLSFGQPNMPEIEREEKINHEIVSLRTGIFRDSIVAEHSDNHSIERVTYEKGEAVGLLNEEISYVTNGTRELQMGDSADCISPLIEENSHKMKLENELIAGGRELQELEFEQKDPIHDERLGREEAKADDEDLELENDKSPTESFDSERVNVDSLDSPPGSPWKHVEEAEEQQQEEEEEEEDEGDDSGSDRAESYSPDASMADIIPMLDELHPLLDEESPLPAQLSHDGSDAASEHSVKSSDSSSESDDNNEKHEELDIEDNEDADDDDEPQGSTEAQRNSAITWTEEDQKNLMDLGNSELERNQRLESLIARRRARKTMSMMPERNLIDLESVDLAFNVAPISTARNNPFDLPHDSYDNMGLPPIPGSAPSILSQRRNPFDLPYDSSEEKPDLMGDSFQQEFKAFQPKDPLFRRHESFSVGPSIFGPGRHDRQESRFKPYFVPERTDSEGTSCSLSFERQFSGLSDSKTSSVPETESVASAGDAEDKVLVEEDSSHPEVLLNSVPEIELSGPAGEPEDKNISEEDISEEPEHMLKINDRCISEEDVSAGTEVTFKIEDVSEHVGHGSQSSEEVESLELGEVEKGDFGAHSENCHEVEQMVVEEGDLDNNVEQDQNDTHLEEDLVKHGYKSASSSSSLSEVSERIFSVREAEVLSPWEENRNDIVEDAGISRQHSLGGSDFVATSVLVGDTPQKQPVYDSSPPPGGKNLSTSSSISSDVHVESEMGFAPVLIKRTISCAERESESSGHDGQNKNYDKGILADSSFFNPLPESQSESADAEISNNHTLQLDSLLADQVNDTTIALAVLESSVNLSSVESRPLPDTSVVGNFMDHHGSHYSLENQVFNSADAQDAVNGVQHQTVSSKDKDFAQSEEQLPTAFGDQVLHHTIPTTEDTSTVEHSVDKNVTFQPEQGQTLLLDSGARPAEKQISAHDQNTSEGRYASEFEELVFLDKSIDQTSSGNNHAVQEPSITRGMVQEVSAVNNVNFSGIQELEQDVPLDVNSPRSPESIVIPAEAYENRATEGYSDTENNTVDESENAGQIQSLGGRNSSAEVSDPQVDMQSTYDVEDEIKEIDDILLSELDTVGDFSVKEYDSAFDTLQKHVTSGVESSSVPRMTKPIGSTTDDDSNGLHEAEPLMYLESRLPQVLYFETQAEEVKSVSGILDTDTSTGDLFQGEIQNSDDLQPTKMVTLPNESEIECENSRIRRGSNPEIGPVMPAIEARSIEDIESMFRKVELLGVRKDTRQDGTEMHTLDQINEATSSGMPILEARSLDDIASAFEQNSERETEKLNINEPIQVHGFTEEQSILGFSYQEQNQNSSLHKPKMELPIVEAELKPDEDDDFDLNEPYEEGHTLVMPGSFAESLQGMAPTLSDLPVMESRLSEDAPLTSKSHVEVVLESNTLSRSREVDANEESTSSQGKLGAKELPDVSNSDENQEAEIEKHDAQLRTKELQQVNSRLENRDSEVGKADLDLTAKGLQGEVEKPETSTISTVKERNSHKSSSNSSSSSDSSSSDSDKE